MDLRIWGKFQQLEVGGIWFRQGVWNRLKHGEKKAENVFEINLTSFYNTQRIVVGVGDAMGRTTSWKYLVFCRKVPESMVGISSHF